NTATIQTSIVSSSVVAVGVTSTQPAGTGLDAAGPEVGVTADGGTLGVWGREENPGGTALFGQAVADNAYGVWGSDQGTSGVGVYGTTTSGTGVLGQSSGSTGVGVEGTSAGNGSAVYGQNTGATGTGVFGDATTGTGVLAHSTSGTALAVNGPAHFSQSGIALVPSGAKSIKVTMAGVTPSSMILATIQQGGGFYVKYAVPAAGSFSIFINKAPASPNTVKVAYFVLN
ncbi:MAG TPA: hypothetical protein VL295_08355, partial [Gemmatimonadales bacterium]|nr:hypothetical protein [Gemmatimonadales bacterium]